MNAAMDSASSADEGRPRRRDFETGWPVPVSSFVEVDIPVLGVLMQSRLIS
jgi:hypothetical protein